MQMDLKLSSQMFARFQALDRESAVRFISRDPADLSHILHPIFQRELLDASELIGFALTLNPLRARVVVKTPSTERASQLARDIQSDNQRWLRLPDSTFMLNTQPPDISRHDTEIELHFNVPEESARVLLQRIAKTDAAPVVATQSAPSANNP
jgi:hypothetical protein